MNELKEELNSFISNMGGDDTVEMPSNWDANKVTAVKSEDNVIVPVPKGFTASTISNEKRVSTGFVIKQGNNGAATSGINEFVWVPVPKPSEMFGTDSTGNSLGKIYEFNGTTASPLNWTETNGVMSWTSIDGCREPDILTNYDGTDSASPSEFEFVMGDTMTMSQMKSQLQNDFEDMRDSVEKYGGFYIGRYETGNLSEDTLVVQKNNTDLSTTWYWEYKKHKTVTQGTEATSNMIWGCQWDATLRWFLTSSDSNVRTYVTNSTNKGNYAGTQGEANVQIPAGSNDDYKVNNIYDMAGNLNEYTLVAQGNYSRVYRGGNCTGSGDSSPVSDHTNSFPYRVAGVRIAIYINI